MAFLPGIVGSSLAMPDIHWGYGFPIGGVAATDAGRGGVISPGGVGYDINCGVRLLRTNLDARRTSSRSIDGADRRRCSATFPAGVGRGRARTGSTARNCRRCCAEGARWAVEHGLRLAARTSSTPRRGGCLAGRRPRLRSASGRMERGRGQCGTLGSRQPLPRGPGRRRDLRRRGRRGDRA